MQGLLGQRNGFRFGNNAILLCLLNQSFKETREYVQTVITSSAIYEELFADIMLERRIEKKNIILNINEILSKL